MKIYILWSLLRGLQGKEVRVREGEEKEVTKAKEEAEVEAKEREELERKGRTEEFCNPSNFSGRRQMKHLTVLPLHSPLCSSLVHRLHCHQMPNPLKLFFDNSIFDLLVEETNR